MIGLTIGLNIEFLAMILIGLFVIYLSGIIVVNTYSNFTAKDIGRLFIVTYMLGVLTVAYLVGSQLFIEISLVIAVIFIIFTMVKLGKKSRRSHKVAAQQGGTQ